MSNITSTDPLADMLTRIRNAIAVRKTEVSMPYSNFKAAVARLLEANSFVDAVHITGEGKDKVLTVNVIAEQGSPHITSITRLSKPGRRHYVRSAEIPVVRRGRGMVIVSTSKGLMTGNEAQTQHLGGELICKVY